ncbi:MAG: 30S ribosomal protein S3 [Chloroflexi bacterium]|nr:30S ribosomal protein S3 [Chloroflexota bacterium]MBI3741861.1 30S ribosomal protein S3 [Chloroflexota bacterium]
MGRKVHPYVFRLGYIKDWRSKWYSADKKVYTEQIAEDRAIRMLIRKQVGHAGISEVRIERFPKQVTIYVHTAKPGIIIGRKGVSVNQLRSGLESLTQKKIKLEVLEVEKPESNAFLVSESIAQQIEKRISHKRAMKQAVTRAMRGGAQGIRINVGGRLSGSEMARREMVREGRIPLNTLRANIDFAKNEANTTYGKIGIKVWVYTGEVRPEERTKQIQEEIQAAAARAEQETNE